MRRRRNSAPVPGAGCRVLEPRSGDHPLAEGPDSDRNGRVGCLPRRRPRPRALLSGLPLSLRIGPSASPYFIRLESNLTLQNSCCRGLPVQWTQLWPRRGEARRPCAERAGGHPPRGSRWPTFARPPAPMKPGKPGPEHGLRLRPARLCFGSVVPRHRRRSRPDHGCERFQRNRDQRRARGRRGPGPPLRLRGPDPTAKE